MSAIGLDFFVISKEFVGKKKFFNKVVLVMSIKRFF